MRESCLGQLWQVRNFVDSMCLPLSQDAKETAVGTSPPPSPLSSATNQSSACPNIRNFATLASTQNQLAPLQDGDSWITTNCSKAACMTQQELFVSEPLNLTGQQTSQPASNCTNRQTSEPNLGSSIGKTRRAVGFYMCEDDDVRPTIDLCKCASRQNFSVAIPIKLLS